MLIAIPLAFLISLQSSISLLLPTASANEFVSPSPANNGISVNNENISSLFDALPLDVLENGILHQLSGQDLYKLYMETHPTGFKKLFEPLLPSFKTRFFSELGKHEYLQLTPYFQRAANNLSIDFVLHNPDWICAYAILKQYVESNGTIPLELTKSGFSVVNSRLASYLVGVDIEWKKGKRRSRERSRSSFFGNDNNDSNRQGSLSSWLPSWLRFFQEQRQPGPDTPPRSQRISRPRNGFLKTLAPFASIEFGSIRTGLSLDTRFGGLFMHSFSALRSNPFSYENLRGVRLVDGQIGTLWIYCSQYSPSVEFLVDRGSRIGSYRLNNNVVDNGVNNDNINISRENRMKLDDEAMHLMYVGTMRKPESLPTILPTKMKFRVDMMGESGSEEDDEYEEKPEIRVDNVRILFREQRSTRSRVVDNGFDDVDVDTDSDMDSESGFPDLPPFSEDPSRLSLDGEVIRRRIWRECSL
jgi:hypothetical protein